MTTFAPSNGHVATNEPEVGVGHAGDGRRHDTSVVAADGVKQALRMMSRSDNDLMRQPIIVVGAGRSGMNFLGDAIAQHPQLAVAHEPRLIWKSGNDRLSDALRARHARPEVITDIRSRFASVVRKAGKERFIDVTPGNSVRLPFVDRVFPDCKFVHFIRDGVDNVLSMRRFYGVVARTLQSNTPKLRDSFMARRARELRLKQVPYMAVEAIRHLAPPWMLPVVGMPVVGVRLPAMSAMRSEMDLLDVCFLQWRSSVEWACQFGRSLPAGRYLECRIETFGEEELRRIYDFLGLDLAPEAIEFVRRHFEPGRIGPAMQDCFPEELERLRAMVEPTMRWIEDYRQGGESGSPHIAPRATGTAGGPPPSNETAPAPNWIESRLEGGVRVFTIAAERVDPKVHLRKDFARYLAHVFASGERRFVLDFSRMRYTDHTYGLLQLVFTAGNALRAPDSRVAACGLRGHLRRAYLFSDVEHFIPEFHTLRRAIANVTAPVVA